MIAFARKSLTFWILKHTSTPVCSESYASLSLSLHFFSTSTETQLGTSPSVFDILRYKYEFSPQLASRVASELTRLGNPENADSVLSFLKECGFKSTQVEKIVNYRPRFLSYSLEGRIKPKIKILQDAGFSSGDIGKIISSNPSILELSVKNNIIPSLSVLQGMLGSNDEVARVLSRSPWFLTANLENTLVPNVEFLKSCGIPMERVRIILIGFPSCFATKPEFMRKYVQKVEEMGLNASSKNFIYAIPTIAKMSSGAWELKLQAFRDLGFSDSDILTMFKKAPQVFYGSKEKIKKVKELLLATGKFDISSIVDSPSSLAFSIEQRLKPRLLILGILESRNLIEKWPCLRTICGLSDDMFSKKFISPYLNEVSDVYIRKSSARGQKEIKP